MIQAAHRIIPACDVDTLEKLGQLVHDTCDVEGIGAYKVGAELVIPYGLISVVGSMINAGCVLPVIYDHQKAGNDIPEFGAKFAKAVAKVKVNAVILFPFGGSVTRAEWTKACLGEGLTVLVGGHMTQKGFLVSEGGYIADDAPERIYREAAEQGVRDFVVPGNKVEFVERYFQLLNSILGDEEFSLYAPGFVKQGGVIADTAKVAGPRWHAIVGSAIYGALDMAAAAREAVSQLTVAA